MDYHRKSSKHDTRSAHPCAFCQLSDPDFSARKAVDQMIVCGQTESARAHLTEEGFLRHRMAELRHLAARMGTPIQVTNSAAA